MKKLPPEILIYVQKMKDFFEKNESSKVFFLKDVDEELFFKYFTDISIKNLTDNGAPELTIEQLDLLNKTVRALSLVKIPIKQENFIDYGIYGKIYLN